MQQDLAEHVTTLLLILGTLASCVAFLFWHMFRRMESKMDEWISEHQKCRQRQEEIFVKRPEFDDWKRGRDGIWRRLHSHRHTDDGKVVITEG